MQAQKKSVEAPENRRLCGARTRAGTPCERAPMPNGRCSKHGGKSLRGAASPRFKHGYYSKCLLTRIGGTVALLREAGAAVETAEDWAAAMRMTPTHGLRR